MGILIPASAKFRNSDALGMLIKTNKVPIIDRVVAMDRFSLRTVVWSFRLLYVVIAFWWPALLRDPIYTPRHARLTGQELHLPMQIPSEEDAQALAIFWSWEHRSLVSTHWILGPYRGVRASEGRMQTFIVLFLFWVIGSIVLSRLDSRRSPVGEFPHPRGLAAWLSTPIWQWFTQRP